MSLFSDDLYKFVTDEFFTLILRKNKLYFIQNIYFKLKNLI
ncbi:MAG: hypothetical protein Ct9H90mP17_4540 [Actinomycetota bacterium]|nr:MAG: hypothetical protein Ct9H90mP17_4540 [Actinomycetota bacterium]